MRLKCRFGVLLVIAAACTLGVGLRGFITLAPSANTVSQRVSAAADVEGQWVSVGPSPLVNFLRPSAYISGRIASIAVDPTDASHWLLGVGNGGVWDSRDAGGNWLPLTDAAPTLATGDVAFDPTDPQTIYVGTGEARGGGMTKLGVGILKSTDGGQTWAVVGAASFAKGAVKRLRVNPANPSELAAASSRGGFGRNAEDFSASSPPPYEPPYGILKSTDAGETWVRTLAGQATALEIDARSFNRQYAAIGESNNGRGAGVAANGVYRSTDAGQHWDPIAGPWGASSATQLATSRIELAMAPGDPNVVYASIAAPPPSTGGPGRNFLGLYRTDNAWDEVPTWRQISTAQQNPGNSVAGSYCDANCHYAHVISVNPSDPNMLFAGGKLVLWRCRNCGSAPQWTNLMPVTTIDGGYDQQTMTWDGSRLIVGNDGGVWSTIDLGATWQNHNQSLSTALFYSGALHPTDPNFMLGGIRDVPLPVRRSSSSWTSVQTPPGGEWGEAEVALSSRHPETDWMVASCCGGPIFRTLDGARTGTRVDTSIDKTGGVAFVAPVRKCPANDDVFLTGTTRLWRTENFFNSTMPSWSPNGPSGANSSSGTIFTITFRAADENCGTYAYGTTRGEIRLTRDGGKTWADLNPGNTVLPPFAINGIAFDPTNGDTIYLAFSNFSPTSPKPRHVYKTTNASSTPPTWVNISPPEDVPFNVIEVDPRNPSLVYAGSDTGLWVSGDAGATWQKIGPDRGLPNVSIHDIKINPATNQTVVFTYGRGAFQLASQ